MGEGNMVVQSPGADTQPVYKHHPKCHAQRREIHRPCRGGRTNQTDLCDLLDEIGVKNLESRQLKNPDRVDGTMNEVVLPCSGESHYLADLRARREQQSTSSEVIERADLGIASQQIKCDALVRDSQSIP